MTLIEAAKRVQAAWQDPQGMPEWCKEMDALGQAIAEAEQQKPVAWMCTETKVLYDHDTSDVDKYHGFKPTVPLYTHPAPRTEQQEPDIYPDEAYEMGLERIAYYASPPAPRTEQPRLTDEEIRDCFQQRNRDKTIERRLIARAIEARILGGKT